MKLHLGGRVIASLAFEHGVGSQTTTHPWERVGLHHYLGAALRMEQSPSPWCAMTPTGPLTHASISGSSTAYPRMSLRWTRETTKAMWRIPTGWAGLLPAIAAPRHGAHFYYFHFYASAK